MTDMTQTTERTYYQLTETVDLRAVKFLNSIKYCDFKNEIIEESEVNAVKKPREKDIKTWYTNLKYYCSTALKEAGVNKRIYRYTQEENQGRLFGAGSLQMISCVYRGLLVRDRGTDLDMSNCHPKVLRYVCKKHSIACPELEYYINNRDECLSEFSDKKIGKTAYLVATNSSKIQWRPFTLPSRYKSYDKEMKTIQTKLLDVGDYQNIQDSMPEYKKTHNYNGSLVNRILCYYENIILQHVIDYINERGIQIMILMFDGLMLYGNHYDDSDLLHSIECYVESMMPGLNMTFCYKQHDTTLNIPESFDDAACDKEYREVVSDDDAGMIMYNELKDKIKYTKGRMFINHGNVWINDTQMIDDIVMSHILTSNIGRKIRDQVVPYCQNLKPARDIRDIVYLNIRKNGYAVGDEFYSKFHSSTKDKLCFIDGVLDFKDKTFTRWKNLKKDTVYSTCCINRKYEEYFLKPDVGFIEEVKKILFLPFFGQNDIERGLQFLSRAITGNNQDKIMATYLANRDCGKGVLYEALAAAFGSYVKPFELNNVCYTRQSAVEESSRKMYWLFEHEFSRISISQETPKDPLVKVNGTLIKKLSGGGDRQTIRRNYDKVDTEIVVQTTFFMMGNDSLNFDCVDVYEHCLQFSSVCQFKSKEEIELMKKEGKSEMLIKSYHEEDPFIKEKVVTEKWKNAIVYLLYQNYKNEKVKVEAYKNQDEDTQMTTRENILESFDITHSDEDSISYSDVNSILFNDPVKKIKNELLSMGVRTERKSNDKKKLKSKRKTIYYGLKLKPVVEEKKQQPTIFSTVKKDETVFDYGECPDSEDDD
jgi:hypothetical protein